MVNAGISNKEPFESIQTQFLGIDHFQTNGAFLVPGFAGSTEVLAMKSRMSDLIEDWTPNESVNSIFKTTDGQEYRNSYFADSAERISFFLEEDAVDKGSGKVRNDIAKEELVNKVGHALHALDPVFKTYSFSSKVKSLVKGLGYTDPVLPQSMYIFKQPRIGGVVTSHQDSTFLYTEPRQSCLGLWLALDDADLENGCLWFRPGSHSEPVRRQFTKDENGQTSFKWLVDKKDCVSEGAMPGNTPEELRQVGFIPLEVKAGDLVGIHGQVDHLSLPNTSGRPRHSFQLHLVEGPRAGVFWSKSNWLQYADGQPFPSLYSRC